MIHGTQKIELAYASVLEALTDYLQKHVAPDVTLALADWDMGERAYVPKTQGLKITFTQVTGGAILTINDPPKADSNPIEIK